METNNKLHLVAFTVKKLCVVIESKIKYPRICHYFITVKYYREYYSAAHTIYNLIFFFAIRIFSLFYIVISFVTRIFYCYEYCS